jgi:hypothetical protein
MFRKEKKHEVKTNFPFLNPDGIRKKLQEMWKSVDNEAREVIREGSLIVN